MLGGFILAIIALFIPPFAVVVRRGCGIDLIINIALLLLAWFPGVLHAWYIILTYPGHRERRRMERRDSRSSPGSSRYGASRSRSRSRSRQRYERRGDYHRRPAAGRHDLAETYARPKKDIYAPEYDGDIVYPGESDKNSHRRPAEASRDRTAKRGQSLKRRYPPDIHHVVIYDGM